MKTVEFVYTLRMFMKVYESFDWEHGKVVIVNGCTPYICSRKWMNLLEQFENREVRNWTHNEDTMVITI